MQFLTGLWSKEKEVTLSPKSVTFGIRFKILAPEYVFNRDVASILNDREMLDSTFWDIQNAKLLSFEKSVEFIESKITEALAQNSVSIDQKKIDLSRLLDDSNGK